MLILSKDGVEIERVGPNSRFTLPNGAVVSPAVEGWEFDGYTLTLAPPPAPITEEELLQLEREQMSCSRLQARTALRRMGLFSEVDRFVRNSGNMELIDAWENASEFLRLSSTIKTLGIAFGLTETQLDDLFRLAVTIKF